MTDNPIDDALDGAFGQSADEILKRDDVYKEEYDDEFWGNEALRQQIVDDVLKTTEFVFDYEVLDREPELPVDRSGKKAKLKLVSIKRPLQIEGETLKSDPLLVRDVMMTEPDRGILIPNPKKPDAIDRMRQQRAEDLSKALRHDPDVISFSEFALPPVTACSPPGGALSAIDGSLDQAVDEIFLSEAEKLRQQADALTDGDTSQCDPFIFFGSAHCTASYYNIGVVSPGAPVRQKWRTKRRRVFAFSDEFEDMKFIESDTKSGSIIHRKRAPARRRGELVRVPSEPGFRVYRTEAGRISVLICSDVIDLNQFATITHLNNEADRLGDNDRIRLVLVPAYNWSEILENACRDLSLSARTNVLLTNAVGEKQSSRAPDGVHRLPDSKLFFLGRDIDRMESERTPIFKSTQVPDDDLWIVEIDLEEQDRVLDRVKPISRVLVNA